MSPCPFRRHPTLQQGHLKRLTFIRRALALRFSIDEVWKLLKLVDECKSYPGK